LSFIFRQYHHVGLMSGPRSLNKNVFGEKFQILILNRLEFSDY